MVRSDDGPAEVVSKITLLQSGPETIAIQVPPVIVRSPGYIKMPIGVSLVFCFISGVAYFIVLQAIIAKIEAMPASRFPRVVRAIAIKSVAPVFKACCYLLPNESRQ